MDRNDCQFVANSGAFGYPTKVSSGKKRKDRSGHPKFNQLAVDYLRSWLLSRQHIEQPYPSEQNYADLSRATGLEKPQLKNWFV